MKKTLTLHDGTPVELDTDDVVSEEVLHQGGEVGETAWEINELTMTTGLKVQVEEKHVLRPPAKAKVEDKDEDKPKAVQAPPKPEPPKVESKPEPSKPEPPRPSTFGSRY